MRQRHIWLILLIWVLGCSNTHEDPRKKNLARLDSVRDEAIKKIHQHMVDLKNTADGIGTDKVMVGFFNKMLATSPESTLAKSLIPSSTQILNTHYVSHYGNFYDILFVERTGFVFHSIRLESDHHANLFTGRLAETNLAHKLQADPDVTFVDFERYNPSGEAAAFFVVPVRKQDEVVGWFVLQYGTNALNAMLADHTDLGRTGEVYLVNDDHLMLSDSRFINGATVLELLIDTEAVADAFTVGKGHAVTRDYRGVQVLSAYNTFEFLDTRWALFAEIDEDEVISAHFQKNAVRMLVELMPLITAGLDQAGSGQLAHQEQNNDFRVDMGELRRVDGGQISWTPGVGPCTSVVAYYPGRFGYLVHLGPTDDVYIDDALTRTFLGSQRTRSLYELTTRIKHFDVVPSELKHINFVVVATHTNSIAGILTTLLNQGIELAQIRFMHNPEADFANVYYNQTGDVVEAEWVRNSSPGDVMYSRAESQQDLASLMRKVY